MKRYLPIGIDLGSLSIKAFQKDLAGRVTAAVHVQRSAPGTRYERDDFLRLRGTLYRKGFWGNRVALSAPKSIVQRLTLDLPPANSGAPIDKIAKAELCRQRDFLPDTFEYTWYQSPQPPRHASGLKAITEVCPHEDANELLDSVEQAGFRPVTLRSQATALADLAGHSGYEPTVAMIDLGWSDSTFITVAGGRPSFVRSVSAGGLGAHAGSERWLADSIARTIRHLMREPQAEITDREVLPTLARYREEILSEVTSALEYIEGCSEDAFPTTLLLAGGGAVVPGLLDDLSSLAAGFSIANVSVLREPGLHAGNAIAFSLASQRNQSERTERPAREESA